MSRKKKRRPDVICLCPPSHPINNALIDDLDDQLPRWHACSVSPASSSSFSPWPVPSSPQSPSHSSQPLRSPAPTSEALEHLVQLAQVLPQSLRLGSVLTPFSPCLHSRSFTAVAWDLVCPCKLLSGVETETGHDRAYCYYSSGSQDRTCSSTGHGYSLSAVPTYSH